jgi:hypothetical protein
MAETEQHAAALELIRREALRSGRTLRGVLTVVRMSEPPSRAERLLLGAVRTLRSPHAIMPHHCTSMQEWQTRYASP